MFRVMVEQDENPSSLSVHRTFVVQLSPFREDGVMTGRVEHVVSGQARTFRALEELVAFLRAFDTEPEPLEGE